MIHSDRFADARSTSVPPAQTPNGGGKRPASARKRKSATLLRRLGEAVCGHRDHAHAYFVGPYRYDPEDGGHRLVGPFPDQRPAQEYMDAQQLSYDTHDVFGPYDGTGSHLPAPPKPRKVTAVVIHVADEDGGNERKVVLNPQLYDAVFWSQSAVEKFLVPYYTAIGSLEEGSVVREAMRRASTLGLVHLPGSEWVDPERALVPAAVPGSEHGVGLYRIDTGAFVEEFAASPVL
jgi:hypothetical protein